MEAYLRRRVKELGGFHRKVVYQGRTGSPDDWCFFPDGQLIIVECKTTGEVPRPDQAKELKMLSASGFAATVADSYEAVDAALSAVSNRRAP